METKADVINSFIKNLELMKENPNLANAELDLAIEIRAELIEIRIEIRPDVSN